MTREFARESLTSLENHWELKKWREYLRGFEKKRKNYSG